MSPKLFYEIFSKKVQNNFMRKKRKNSYGDTTMI
tara:strand:+ start:327 stop:428 length:102 start_codon:yes stop_codon:yes gene_type:complete